MMFETSATAVKGHLQEAAIFNDGHLTFKVNYIIDNNDSLEIRRIVSLTIEDSHCRINEYLDQM